ncbi:MAG TPA: tetratricopeptide repeat protein [Candidatus Sulfotelmatobacter sp.]|nr:tetratricopeptide repeat protein [Candidatus Sulfotelmatobacter sp.]
MKLAQLLLLIFSAFPAPSLPRPLPPRQLLTEGRADDAIRTLQDQVQHHPADAESYNLLCRAYFMIDAWDPAIAACDRAINLDPRNSMYQLWLGRVYGEKADHASFLSAAGPARQARNAFERAVQLDPANWEARVDLAEFYAEAPGIIGGGKDKARGQADALMTLNSAMAHWILARVAEKEKHPDIAEREYRAEIADSHSGARGWLDLASFFRREKRIDEMEQALHALDSCRVDNPEALMDGAHQLLRENRDLPFAVGLLRRYLQAPAEAGPAFKAHDLLGQIFEKQGDKLAAAGEYRAALALARSYARAQENLKRVGH